LYIHVHVAVLYKVQRTDSDASVPP
jgi:hypothetical protein